jgi:hypothetical protein
MNRNLVLVHTRLMPDESEALTLLARHHRLSRTQLIAGLLLNFIAANATVLEKLRAEQQEGGDAAA